MYDVIRAKLKLLEKHGYALTVQCTGDDGWDVSSTGEKKTIFTSPSPLAVSSFLSEYLVTKML
ncbi:hypothetical protein LPW11_10715 [Geomonas sp. RF6]|uniref:hypothetical protein n=1 Tax=Geomonas sp. RF6 TaxID=2897342 RepID=UPI001E5B9817|nr:hypothetical protein [Geomonas sp. RF6]UFS72645.1 hypothetical protein LPW11_10715 [Geomonas sp. RF6]